MSGSDSWAWSNESSAASGDIQASSELCSGRIPLLLLLLPACCCLWTPWGFDSRWEAIPGQQADVPSHGTWSGKLCSVCHILFSFLEGAASPPLHLSVMQVKPFPARNQVYQECLYWFTGFIFMNNSSISLWTKWSNIKCCNNKFRAPSSLWGVRLSKCMLLYLSFTNRAI